MKSYTDLEQSKRLEEILPLESADMSYTWDFEDEQYYINTEKFSNWIVPKYAESAKHKQVIPCWSLAELLNILPIVYINNKNEVCGPLHIDVTDSETPFVLWYVNPLHKGSIVELKTKEYNNLVDACYEMIIKLHEQKLL